MRPPVSATLAVWASAWLDGRVGFDDVLEAVTFAAQSHVVVDLRRPESVRRGRGDAAAAELAPQRPSAGDPDVVRLGAVLIDWRAEGEPVRVCLPVPGDVRGVPATAEFQAAALDAGQAAFAGRLGLVPSAVAESPSSAPPVITWRAFTVDPAVPDPYQLSEAEHDLAVAVRETATLLRDRDLTGGRRPETGELERVRRAAEGLQLPAGFPARAAGLLASAERLQAMLDLAGRDVHGGAVDRDGIATRTAALRDLAVTVRRARLAGYNAVVPPAAR